MLNRWEEQKPQGHNFCENIVELRKMRFLVPEFQKPQILSCQSKVPLVLRV